MQDYEQYTRISRAPVILPPAGASAAGEEEPKAEQETAAENQPQEEYRTPAQEGPVWQTVRLAGNKSRSNRLLIVQTLICAAVLAALLLARGAAPETYEQIRGWYNEAMSRVITVSVTPPEETLGESTAPQAEVSSEPETSAAQPEESQSAASGGGEG